LLFTVCQELFAFLPAQLSRAFFRHVSSAASRKKLFLILIIVSLLKIMFKCHWMRKNLSRGDYDEKKSIKKQPFKCSHFRY